jgi:hypothetical protein
MAADAASGGGRPWRRRLLLALGALVGVVVVALVVFVVVTRNPSPGSFYAPSAEVPARPGTIIQSEPFSAGVPAGARAWRVLYSSTSEDGRPIAVSGLILAPKRPPPGWRPVLALGSSAHLRSPTKCLLIASFGMGAAGFEPATSRV